MIKKLRIKFIAITMAAVVVVLAVIMTVVNVVNFANVERDADALVDVIAENGGKMPLVQGEVAHPPAPKGREKRSSLRRTRRGE